MAKMVNTREEWYDLAMNRGTSGDMVFNILRDWKREQEVEEVAMRLRRVISCARTIVGNWNEFGPEGNMIDEGIHWLGTALQDYDDKNELHPLNEQQRQHFKQIVEDVSEPEQGQSDN